MLSDPVLIRQTRHRAYTYDGQQEAIVDQETRDRVQKTLQANRVDNRDRPGAARPSPLAGKMVVPIRAMRPPAFLGSH